VWDYFSVPDCSLLPGPTSTYLLLLCAASASSPVLTPTSLAIATRVLEFDIMTDVKEAGMVSQSSPIDMENTDVPSEKKGTLEDQRDMFRMGKAQELRVSLYH
jgi:hypothetical protein